MCPVSRGFEFSSPYPERALAYGSGMIDLIRAKDPGLVYEMSVEELQKVWCSLTNASLSRTCRKTLEEHQLIYPSISFRVQENKPFIITFNRRVKNIGYKNSRYWAHVNGDRSMLHVVVKPNVLRFKNVNEEKDFTIDVGGSNMKLGTVAEVSLIWSDGHHKVRSPILIYAIEVPKIEDGKYLPI
ncbi:hypothetical protein QVD17_21057 [Tagetes erecta]|uniref:Subtilisin-like protease fibronectin type-III domain-containing protein n=1 Tax=Tagetes erecta TaxID=13708 RepID=A0AAD8NYJ9_TARER|nr:hypothetical protein QVD17_21057 [Tagetes erecta]